jgi:sepiapterin reductase
MAEPFSTRNIAILVTGASRGFGRSISIAVLNYTLEKQCDLCIHFVLHASRISEELNSAAKQLRAIADRRSGVTYSVELVGMKLDSPDPTALSTALRNESWTSADEHFLFNNAGILGKTGESISSLRFRDYLAPMLVNAVAMGQVASLFLESTEGVGSGGRYIVHTSSAASQHPIKTWAPYSMSKAASDMLHATIAEEFREASRHTRVLQWAPGPLVTDMTAKARNSGANPATSARWVHPDESAFRLISVLVKDEYRTGEHIDFFDDVPGIRSQIPFAVSKAQV